jgi:hypothetical protein
MNVEYLGTYTLCKMYGDLRNCEIETEEFNIEIYKITRILHFVRRPVIKDAEIDHRFSET